MASPELVVKVDFIVRTDTPYRHVEFERRRRVRVDGRTLAGRTDSHGDARGGASMTTALDTAVAIDDRVRAMMRAKSPSDRVVMACGMLDVARATILASWANEGDEAERRVHLFTRLYGRDFDSDAAARIVACLRGAHHRPHIDPST